MHALHASRLASALPPTYSMDWSPVTAVGVLSTDYILTLTDQRDVQFVQYCIEREQGHGGG